MERIARSEAHRRPAPACSRDFRDRRARVAPAASPAARRRDRAGQRVRSRLTRSETRVHHVSTTFTLQRCKTTRITSPDGAGPSSRRSALESHRTETTVSNTARGTSTDNEVASSWPHRPSSPSRRLGADRLARTRRPAEGILHQQDHQDGRDPGQRLGLVPRLREVVDLFNENHDDVQICWTNAGQGNDEYTKFSTAIEAGSGAPDVIMLESEVHLELLDPQTRSSTSPSSARTT